MSGLDPTNISALRFNENIAKLVEDAYLPLNNYLGITHFGYIKVLNDGTMLRMANRPEWTKKYFEQSFYNDVDLYGMENVPENGTRISFLTGNPTTDHHKALCWDYDIWNSLIISRKFSDCSDFWFFGTLRDNTEILNYYANNISLFKEFTIYFKNTFSNIIDKHDSSHLIVSRVKKLIYNDVHDKSTEKILQKMQLRSYHLKDGIYLSQRERECLFYLSTGKTMKEIARLIKVSPRTVESYISTIKQKTKNNTKSSLIKLFHESPHYI
jgi:DNA-binding CsgD family transcriptional regulator